jgi:5-methyltetrahydrofolate--homocysteine methyltransferase
MKSFPNYRRIHYLQGGEYSAMPDIEALAGAIENGRRSDAVRITMESLHAGISADVVLGHLLSGMETVGRQFKANEIFMPEVLIASRAMKECMSILDPHLAAAGIEPKFTAVIGAVRHDLHDIGKNLVSIMWRGAHIRVIDLGTNVSAERFIEAAREHNAELIGLSSLLTTTMPEMARIVEAIKSSDLPAKVIIGGAPISQRFATEIGADGFAPDAARAVDEARRIVAA